MTSSFEQQRTELPLRGHGPLVDPFTNDILNSDSLNTRKDPPRALKSLARIVDDDLCHRCGSCVGICPTNVLGTDDSQYPLVKDLSACIDCDLCVKVCPGDEFNAPLFSKQLFGTTGDADDCYGEFESAYLSYAKDPAIRTNSTSGGLVTALLISLLERGEIDGCVVVVGDETVPYRGVAKIARTRDEVLKAVKSKYAMVPTNALFKEILQQPGRYAFLGLPCQIHGVHKAFQLENELRKRIVFTIAFICHAVIEEEPLQILYDRFGERKKEISSFQYRQGKHAGVTQVKLKNGQSQSVMFPSKTKYQPDAIEMVNLLYRLYSPTRCFSCYDAMGEFADLTVGDPWMPKPFDDIDFKDGYTYTLARTPQAQRFLKMAEEEGYIVSRALSREAAKTCNVSMAKEKRHRAFRLLDAKARLGQAAPNYHFSISKPKIKQRILTEVSLLGYILCYFPTCARYVFRFALSDLGYAGFWLNNKRRRFRTWRRDLTAKLQRGFHKA